MQTTISLRKALFISFTLVSIIPVLFLSFGVQRAAFDLELNAVEDKHLIIAKNVTRSLERYLHDVKSGLRAFTENIKSNKPSREIIDLMHDLNYLNIWLIKDDSSSQMLMPAASALTSNQLSQITLKQILKSTKNFSSPQSEINITGVIRNQDGLPVFFVTKKLSDNMILAGSVGIDYIRNIQEDIAFGDKGHAAIVDQYGKVMAHPHKEWVRTSKDLSFLLPVKKMKSGLTGVTQFYTPLMDEKIIAGYTVVKSVGWGVMIPQPISELEEEAKYGQIIALLVTLLGMAIAGLLSWWLSVYITRPLNSIISFTKSIATGDIEKGIPVEKHFAPSEIHTLSNAFNQMVQRLKNRTDELIVTAIRLRHAQKIARLGNWELDALDHSMWWSDEVYRILNIEKRYGYSPNLTDFVSKMCKQDRDIFLQKITFATAHDKPFSLEQKISINSSKSLTVQQEILFQHKKNDKDIFITGTIQDVSERKKYENRLYFQAHHDSLTKLPNRELCLEKLKNEIERTAPENGMTPLLIIGLDHFKEVNESLGHLAGDQILKMAAERIKRIIAYTDTVARLGGDEFAVVLTHIKNQQELVHAIESIIHCFEKSFFVNEIETIIGSSIGVSVYPRDGSDPHALLQKAATALHEVKTLGGRGTYSEFSSTMNEAVLKRVNLRSDLALAIRNAEFHLVYQPIVDAATGQTIAAEALLRWHHPTRGAVSPEIFIPLAEKTGYIRDIGLWTLRTACQEIRKWRNEGLDDLTMSINLSVNQVKFGFDKSTILNALQEFDLKPSDLTLEITESIIMEDMDSCLDWMNEITDAGLHLAIDDFGTGYSSLSYLLNLPVSSVKIDGSFVSNMLYGEKDATLIEAIVTLSKKLGFIVVAEGVETIEHRKQLINYGCDLLQGHFFSKPLASKEFLKFIQLTQKNNKHLVHDLMR